MRGLCKGSGGGGQRWKEDLSFEVEEMSPILKCDSQNLDKFEYIVLIILSRSGTKGDVISLWSNPIY